MLEVRTWEEAGKKNEEREKLTNTGPIWLLQTHTKNSNVKRNEPEAALYFLGRRRRWAQRVNISKTKSK